MTALMSAPAVTLRPVPWHRMGWVAWRRYRTTLLASLGVLAVFTIYLIVTGHRARSAYAAVLACKPASSSACMFLDDNFHNTYGSGGLMTTALILLPGLLGAFAGAPLLARELEIGTFRYAWTQGIGRIRWAIALIVPAVVVIVVAMTTFGFVTAWHNKPLVSYGIIARLEPSAFPLSYPSIAAWTLVGFALGVFAGLLWRRVLPALATAFGAWFGLALVTAKFLRPHYLSPLTTTSMQMSNRNLILDEWWTKDGVRASNAQLNAALQSVGANIQVSPGKVAVHASGTDPIQYLLQHGYQQVTRYQPNGRFWTFQWIEFGWLVVLSAVLLSASVWLLRRRPT